MRIHAATRDEKNFLLFLIARHLCLSLTSSVVANDLQIMISLVYFLFTFILLFLDLVDEQLNEFERFSLRWHSHSTHLIMISFTSFSFNYVLCWAVRRDLFKQLNLLCHLNYYYFLFYLSRISFKAKYLFLWFVVKEKELELLAIDRHYLENQTKYEREEIKTWKKRPEVSSGFDKTRIPL